MVCPKLPLSSSGKWRHHIQARIKAIIQISMKLAMKPRTLSAYAEEPPV